MPTLDEDIRAGRVRYEVARQRHVKTPTGTRTDRLSRSGYNRKSDAEKAAKDLATANQGKLISLIDHETKLEREFIAKNGKVRELRW